MTALPGSTFPFTPDHNVPCVGCGATQLAGSYGEVHVFGPPAGREEALAVLREALEPGIRHVDTAEFCGPFVTNRLIREYLHADVDDVTVVTEDGSVRDDAGNWATARDPDSLRSQMRSTL